MLFCLHVEEPASGPEEGGSQLMHNTENFFNLFCLFVCSQLGAGLGSIVVSPWDERCCTKSKFQK